MSDLPRIGSVCVFCGSSNAAAPAYMDAAAAFGEVLAGNNIRLVYGGGGVGLQSGQNKICRNDQYQNGRHEHTSDH